MIHRGLRRGLQAALVHSPQLMGRCDKHGPIIWSVRSVRRPWSSDRSLSPKLECQPLEAASSAPLPPRSAPPNPPSSPSSTAPHTPPPRVTFHKRTLPSELTSFTSVEGKRMFHESLEAGLLEAYFPLSEQFITQNEPAFCGMGSLAMVLNALKVDPRRPWKGPWRWFTEETLECCFRPLEIIRTQGISLDDFQEIALCHGSQADVYRPCEVGEVGHREDLSSHQVTEGQFRDHVMQHVSTQTDPPSFMVVSFWRPDLGQTGTGHFSPIAGYHPESDRVLVLDVARFKYPPYWVELPSLYEAMKAVDSETGRPRGYCSITAKPQGNASGDKGKKTTHCRRNREHQFCDFRCDVEDCARTTTGRSRVMNSAGELNWRTD